MHVRLRADGAHWALDQPEPPMMANPEPLSLLLMDGGLLAAGYVARKRRGR